MIDPARMRVNHLSIAVRDMDAALAFFDHWFPIRPMHARAPGHTGDYTWCDFFIGDFKLELISSAAPGSFVERFLAKRGEGLHHLSLEVPDFDAAIARLERGGVRIVDRFEQDGDKTAFISPRSAFGTLIQFWNAMDEAPAHPPVATHRYGGEPVRVRVNHVSLAVRDLEATLAFFGRFFPITPGVAPREVRAILSLRQLPPERLQDRADRPEPGAPRRLRPRLPREARRGLPPRIDRRRPPRAGAGCARGRRRARGRALPPRAGRPRDRLHLAALGARRADPVLGASRDDGRARPRLSA